jgi:hypothetical protein
VPDVVVLHRPPGNPVAFYVTAAQAPVDYLHPFSAMMRYTDRFHQSGAPALPVTRSIIRVFGIQTERAVVPITAVGYRQHRHATVFTYESSIFCMSVHA